MIMYSHITISKDQIGLHKRIIFPSINDNVGMCSTYDGLMLFCSSGLTAKLFHEIKLLPYINTSLSTLESLLQTTTMNNRLMMSHH